MRRSLAAIAFGLVACAQGGGGWDVRAIEAAHPGVAQYAGHRLGDLAPHFWIAGDELVQFSCRWSSDRPVAVWAMGASPAEQELLDRALAALERAIPGLAFERAEDPARRVGIGIEFADPPAAAAGRPAAVDSGDAVADCRVDETFAGPRVGRDLVAQLESASVRIWRSRLDLLGRFVALDETELFAAVLHELGHAVGYASHTRRGYSVMRAAPGEVRLQARPALRGESLREPTLAALYALPSGSVLRRDPIPREAAATARVFADLAQRSHWERPRSRAGAISAELWWPDPDGGRRVLRALRGSGAWPASFSLRANRGAREALRSAAR